MAIDISPAPRQINNVADLRQHTRARFAELQKLSGDPEANKGEIKDGLVHATFSRDPGHWNDRVQRAQYRIALMKPDGGLQRLEVGHYQLSADQPTSYGMTTYEALPPGRLTSAAHRFLGGRSDRASSVLTDFLTRHQHPFQRTSHINCLDGTLETKLKTQTGTIFDPPDEFGSLTQKSIAVS